MSLYLGENLVSGIATPIEPTRNIGQIITSTIPLTDAGLHLLDGALIQSGGIYNDFVQYIANLVNLYPQCFCNEADWQVTVNTYGACGKFVYDSTNNTVRLPKITGFIEGTVDSNALGELVEAGLPNITGTMQTPPGRGGYYGTGAFSSYAFENQNDVYVRNDLSSGIVYGMQINATWSNSIYGNSNTVQPQSIKVFYYIVIATTTKTDIEVDIDEVITDLNSKAIDIDVVHKIGDETITGNKTFTGILTIPASTFIKKEQGAGREYEGGELQFEVGTNSPLLDPVHLDVYHGRFRVFGTASDGVTREIINADIENNNLRAPSSDSLNSVITTTGIFKSANGYVKLGNGIIIQWGNAGGGGTITFPTPFSSDNFSVTATIKSANGTNDNDAITGKRTTSFDFHNYSGGGCLWIAIGY